MKSNDLIELIGDVKDEHIRDAKAHKKSRMPRWAKWSSAVAACLVLAVCSTMLIQYHDNEAQSPTAGGAGHGEGTVFMSYAGPIFPLTVLENESDLHAQRQLTYDFSVYSGDGGDIEQWGRNDNCIIFTDSYTLTNNTDEELQGTAVYPIAGDFQTMEWPEITVNGEAIDWQLHAGAYSGDFRGAGDEYSTSLNLDRIASWEGYETLLRDGGYLDAAFEDAPALTTPVVVYKLSDITGGDQIEAASLCMSFVRDPEKTQILTYGFNGGGTRVDTGEEYRDFFIRKGLRKEDENIKYLIIVGEDLSGYTLQGYQDGGCTPGEEIDAGATVVRQEMVLGDALYEITKMRFDAVSGNEFDGDHNRYINDKIDFEMYYREVCRYFAAYGPGGTDPKERYEFGRLEEIVQEVAYHDRILYLTFDINVPSGKTAEVTVCGVKNASFDFSCTGSENEGIDGYDMVTTLGSNLVFQQQTASIENYSGIEIVRQNYGFDLEAGITEVTLDLSQPHYWLEIRKIAVD